VRPGEAAGEWAKSMPELLSKTVPNRLYAAGETGKDRARPLGKDRARRLGKHRATNGLGGCAT